MTTPETPDDQPQPAALNAERLHQFLRDSFTESLMNDQLFDQLEDRVDALEDRVSALEERGEK